jgi:hypothetical protein
MRSQPPVLACVLVGTALAGLAAAQGPAKGAAPREDARLGLVLLYADKTDAKEYFPKHPCVSGGWQFERETDTHWIGKLNYPTGNVPPAYPDKNEAAFVVGPLKVARKPGLAIDLKKWKGSVVLRMADAKERFGTVKSLESSFALVAYQIPPDVPARASFLFKKHSELLYKGAVK